MSLLSRVLLDFAALSSLSIGKEVGYFDSSSCADPKGMPSNGTKTMSNVGGVISAPVDATATAGTKTTVGSDATATSSATGTAESDVKPGMGSSLIAPSWTMAGSVDSVY
ncbi:hypothetical protein LT330_008708 [Penicillium expansum]|nr:hypothetical protein LT330_008708 [Penicillium expansum]